MEQPTSDDTRRKRFFLRNPESGEPWAYCGDLTNRAALETAFGVFVVAEIEADMGGGEGERFALEVKAKEMTDAEVESLPSM